MLNSTIEYTYNGIKFTFLVRFLTTIEKEQLSMSYTTAVEVRVVTPRMDTINIPLKRYFYRSQVSDTVVFKELLVDWCDTLYNAIKDAYSNDDDVINSYIELAKQTSFDVMDMRSDYKDYNGGLRYNKNYTIPPDDGKGTMPC